MKWEVWQELTREEREEYEFKYGKPMQEDYDAGKNMFFFIIPVLVIFITWLMLLILLSNQETDFVEQIIWLGKATEFISKVLIGFGILFWVSAFIKYLKSRKWLKSKKVM